MSKLEELIQQYCPDGVEYVKLKEISIRVCSGGTPSRGNADYFLGNIPWLRTQEVDFRDIYDTEIKITEEAVKNSSAKIIPKNCVIVAMYGATAGKVGINKIPLTTNQACCNLQIDPQKALFKYVYYWLCHEYDNIKSLGQGSQNNINAQIVKDYLIPVPPLPVQEEIVRILDTFSNYTAELNEKLQAELQARRAQYDFYRNQLLSFDGRTDIQWRKLGDVCDLGTGSHNTQDGLLEGEYPFYTRGIDILRLNNYDYDETAIITAGDGAGVGKVFHFVSGKYALHQRAYRIVPNEEIVLARFVYYHIGTSFYNYIMKSSVSSSVVSIRKPMLIDYPIPVPSLAEQQRIVSILDRFDTLVNDLTTGLPAEIEKRQQQYEYYRDRLLTFKKKA